MNRDNYQRHPNQEPADHGFWAPPQLPFLEIRSTLNSTKPYAPHFHPGFSLGLILSGQTRFKCCRDEHLAETGDMVLIEPEMVHSCIPIDGRARGFHMLYHARQWCLAQTKAPPSTGLKLKQRDLKAAEIFKRLLELVESIKAGEIEGESRLGPIIGRLISANLEETGPASQTGDLSRKTRRLIAGDLEHRAKIGDVARRLGLRRESFIRQFRRGRGLTPGAFQQCLRLQEARRLMRRGSSISEAALAAGYVDQSHFHRMFVKYFSVTPRQYRLNRSLFYKK